MALPFVFMIGDSISMQYGPFLAQYLGSKAIYARKGDIEKDPNFDSNGRDSTAVLEYIQSLIDKQIFQANILLVNCGLHDIKRDLATNECQVPAEQYKLNLKSIVDIFPSLADRMVWVSSTPVSDEIHNSLNHEFRRFNADVEVVNQIAREIMGPVGIQIIDLYAFTQNLSQPTDLYVDHVHYCEEVQKLQAAYIAGSLERLL